MGVHRFSIVVQGFCARLVSNDGDCVSVPEILYALLEELRVYDSKRNWASEVHKERKKAHCLKCGIFYSKIADMCQMSDCTG